MEGDSSYRTGSLPQPLQDMHQYQMLVAKLRHKADRENNAAALEAQHSNQLIASTNSNLKDSKLSHHSKTASGANYDNEPS